MIAALTLALAALPQQPAEAAGSGAQLPNHLAVLEADGGAARLVGVYGRRFRLLDLAGAADAAAGGAAGAGDLVLPGDSTLWTVAALEAGGREQLLVIVEGDALHRVEVDGDTLRLSEPLAQGLKAVPPRGIHPAEFVNDLDSDGRPDLLLPAGDRLRVWFGGRDGFREGPDLGAVSRLLLGTGSGDLLDRVSRVVEVPRLRPRDVNADGRPDLVVSDGLRIHQYVVSGDGFPQEPTRTLDLGEYRTQEKFELDFTNVAKAVRWIVNDEWADLDGDGRLDAVVLADGMVRIFLGGKEGIQTGKGTEKQVFKIGGNLLYALPARIDDDAVPDVVLVRVEDVGIGKLLRMALWSWTLRFDFIVFQGRGDGTFSKRPIAQHQVKLEGESIMKLSTGDQRDRFREIRKRVVRTGDLDGDGRATDLAVLEPDGTLRVWRDTVGEALTMDVLAGEFLREALGGSSEVDLDVQALEEWLLGRTSAVAAAAGGRVPDFERKLGGDWAPPHALTLRDLDGDGDDEILVLRSLPPAEEGGPRRLLAFAIAP